MYIFPAGIIFAFVLITIGSLHEVKAKTGLHPVLKDESACASYATNVFKYLRKIRVDFDEYKVPEAILTQGFQSSHGLEITRPESILRGLESLGPRTDERCSFSESSDGRRVVNITLKMINLSLNLNNAKLTYWPNIVRYTDILCDIKQATVILQLKQQEYTGLLEVNSLSVIDIDDTYMFIGLSSRGYNIGHDEVYKIVNDAFHKTVQEALDNSIKDVLNEHLNSI